MGNYNNQTIEEITQKLNEAGINMEKVFLSGKQAQYDEFWDDYQENGKRVGYVRAFGGDCWTEHTFKPKYDLTVKDGYAMFAYFGYKYQGSFKELLERQGVALTFPNALRIGNIFEGSYFTELGEMDFSTVIQVSPAYVFHGCARLHTIEKVILSQVVSFTYQNWFSGCTALKNIAFEGEIANDIDFHWSTMLTWDSLNNIVNHLSDSVVGKTLTLSKVAVDEAFVFHTGWIDSNTGEYISIVSKGTDEDNPYWWDLVATKPNWTITVV